MGQVPPPRHSPGVWLFRLLLLLFPRNFRHAYREQLVEAYIGQRSEARYRGAAPRGRPGRQSPQVAHAPLTRHDHHQTGNREHD
jgi:hypothetical protein